MSEKKKPQLEKSWLDVLHEEFDKPYMQKLRSFLQEEKRNGPVYPPGPMIFNALNTTPLDQVKVVLLGQDPYHGPGQAHGLSFSVQRGVYPPPSLQNMFKEIKNSLGIDPPGHGDLTAWAQQGVLLLNTTLTVRARQPKSHANKGWETFTDRIIQVLSEKRDGLVFLLWGRHAGAKASLIDAGRHLVLQAAHPSPYSANAGFFGCNHFGQANQYLSEHGKTPVNWQLPA